MATIELIKISTCIDCAFALSNGATGDEECTPLSKMLPGETVSIDADSGEYFSHSGCDLCETKLSGDRFDGDLASEVSS